MVTLQQPATSVGQSNYALQRMPGTSYVPTNHRGPAPLNTALGITGEPSWRFHGPSGVTRQTAT
jgi:hypothetical protein